MLNRGSAGVTMSGSELFNKLREDFSILRGNLLVLVVSWIFLYFAGSMVYPYETLYLQALGASPFTIGLIGSLGTALLCFSRIPGAYIADRYGRRKIIVTMTYGAALSYVLLAVAPDWRFATLGIAIYNLCLIYQPALQAITADSISPEKRGMGYALANVVPSAPAVLAPLAVRFLVEQYGFMMGVRITYWLVMLLSLTAAVVRTLWLEETLKTSAKPGRLSSEFKRSVIEVFAALKGMSKPLAVLTLIMLISSFEEPMFHSFMSLYAVDVAGISKPDWALLNVIYLVVPLVAGIPLGRLVDIVGRKKALLAAYALWIPSTAYFVYCRNLIGMALVFVVFTLGASLFMPAYQALLADLTPREMRGRVMGVVGTLNLLVMIPASALGGLLYEMKPASPFLLCVVLGMVCMVLIVLLIKEPVRREV